MAVSFPAELWRRVEAGNLSPGEALRLFRAGGPPAPGAPGEVPGSGSPSRKTGAPARTGPEAGEEAAEAERLRQFLAVLAELDALVGLDGVKRSVREIGAMARVQELRRRAGLATGAMTLHMVFTGHPGTGKTTVARILGRLFQALGILPRGHLVEVERADLVGEYIGHTAVKTRETIRRALGGVLFIDEAYSLARGGEKDFGKEAIDCLVKAAEDHRQELLVILAGYPAEMEWFLMQNPGLQSRFPIRIHFPDYSPAELCQIAEQMLAEQQYRLTADARAYLRGKLQGAGWSFAGEAGNARAVRNLLERALRCQALRLLERAHLGREDLMTITRRDLEEACRSW
ncbi:MAG: AAA family ATPase [Bacillota bacterium]